MQPQIKQEDVESMDGEQDVKVLHETFYDGFLASREAYEAVPDWLEEQDAEDYRRRKHTHKYDKYVQGKMTEWLSNLQEEKISSEKVRKKYLEYKNQFLNENPDIEPDTF